MMGVLRGLRGRVVGLVPESVRRRVWRRRAQLNLDRTAGRPLRDQGPRRYQIVTVDRPMRRLHTGRFAAAHDRYAAQDPWIFYDPDMTRMSNYFLCMLAEQALAETAEGDLLLAGVSYGTSAKVIAEALDVASTGRGWWLIDPFDGSGASRYNHEVDTALQGWDDRIPAHWVKGYIPEALDQVTARLAFVHVATGKYSAESRSFPRLIELLVPGGGMMLDIYGTLNADRQARVDLLLGEHGLRSWELPTGQLAVRRPSLDSRQAQT
jgi:hypothetical protein